MGGGGWDGAHTGVIYAVLSGRSDLFEIISKVNFDC